MEDSAPSAAPAAAVGQKNAVEIFVNALEKSAKAARIYAYASGQDVLDSVYQNTVGALERALLDNDEIEVIVKPFELIFDRKVIYENKERKGSLSFAIYQDGIRMLTFKKGLSREELLEIISILATDFSKPEMMDQDLYSLFVERGLPHLEVTGADLLEEARKEDPELAERLKNFIHEIGQKAFPVKPTTPRKLRSDDIKVLEEFRLNPVQFNRTDEEVSRVIETLSSTREIRKRERETLERLLLMGFHFLLSDKSREQVQVGRELVSKLALMVLEEAQFDLLDVMISKIYQLQKDRPDQSGEYQKIVDTIFHVDNFKTFQKLLKTPDYQKDVTALLLKGPSSAVRLTILLIGSFHTLTKWASDFILRNLPAHMSWLLEEVTRTPDNDSWEQVINVMASRPTHHFQRFLETLIHTAGPAVKAKVLKQLAVIATSESMKFFEKMLSTPDTEERILAFRVLSQAKNVHALKLIKGHVESESFRDASPEEKEAGYIAIAAIAGENSFSWFESLWMQPGTGLFRKKAETERRLLLVKALLKVSPEFIERMLAKTPLESLPPELSQPIQRALQQRKGGQ